MVFGLTRVISCPLIFPPLLETLIFETENDKDIWQLALTATIQGSTRGSPVVPRRGSDSSAFTADKFRPASAEHPKPSLVEAPVQLLPLSETRRKETVEWLNPLIARFWQNIRVNSSMKEALRTKLASKLMQKVTEKKLSGYLVRSWVFFFFFFVISRSLTLIAVKRYC